MALFNKKPSGKFFIKLLNMRKKVVAGDFDTRYYLAEYPDIAAANAKPLQHYMKFGWREGRNPSPNFDTNYYLSKYEDIRESGINPFLHYILYGKKEGRLGCHTEQSKTKHGGNNRAPDSIKQLEIQEEAVRCEFDASYYLSEYPDVSNAEIDPLRHYMLHGWREGRNPSPHFNTNAYLITYDDVRDSDLNPFYHYVMFGKLEGRFGEASDLTKAYLRQYVPHHMQDVTFPLSLERAKSIIVIMVPEHNTMSGGIYSLFSIAKAIYDMRRKHDYEVVLMTRPNKPDITYLRQVNFRNYEDVFRFSQILRCKMAEKIYLCIPEYSTPDFFDNLDIQLIEYLRTRKELYINIMNQNIDLMPEREEFQGLFHLGAREVTQSVAHHAYFNQDRADRYNLPTLLLPAYTDLSGYPALDLREKEKLVIYSPDELPHRKPVLEALEKQLEGYELLEVKDITFDTFMDLATRCMFSITFGEGFDGYIAQPIYQGGIGFACYREEYFPSSNLKNLANIFDDEEDMIKNIVARIYEFEKDEALYRDTNKKMLDIYNSLYSKQDYLERTLKLVKREFEIYPGQGVINTPIVR